MARTYPNPAVASLRQSLRSPGHWGVFAFIYLSFSVFLLWSWRQPSPTPLPGLGFAMQLVVHFVFFFMFVWLSPLPWRWTRAGHPPGFARGAVQAFFYSQGLMLGLLGLDSLLKRTYGGSPHGLDDYLLHACFQAPSVFVVGYLAAHRDLLQKERFEMTAQVAEAQSRQLQGQLHPHVLFNALNALAEVIQEDKDKAEANVRAMSSLLRRVLNASEASTFALSEEVALVKDYLSMEAMRLESRLRVAWDWDDTLDGWRTLPLVLQPLVENAVKHGISRSRTGGDLLIRSSLETGVVVLEVRNTGVALGDSEAGGTGIGLKNLRRRLEMAYGDGARLVLRYEDGWTVAEIRIQMDRLNPAFSNPSGRHPNLSLEATGARP